MFENSFEKQKSQEQGQLVKIEVATPLDWEAYRNLRLTLTDKEDIAMLGIEPERLAEMKTRADDEEYWKKQLEINNLKFVLLAFKEVEPGGKIQEKKEALGMISAKSTEDKGVWYIYASYIKPDIRRKGLGEAMLADCLGEIEFRGGERASMRVNTENDKQLKLVDKFFFEIDTSKKIMDGEYSMFTDLTDEQVMKKVDEVLRSSNK